MFLILFANYFLSVVSVLDKVYSATIIDNKLIAIYNTEFDFNVYVKVYELEERTVANLYNNGKAYAFGRPDYNFSLETFDVPEVLQESNNKLWLKFALVRFPKNHTISPVMTWVGYINLDDMSFKNDSSFISFPTHENFPSIHYNMNTITNEFGSTLYITGGKIYSKKNNPYFDNYFGYMENYSECNSFYKYNFTSKEWVDMTYSVNGKLKPLFNHNSVVVENRYLVILGGMRRIIYNSTFNYDFRTLPYFEYNSLYNLSIFDSFTNSWENVKIKADLFDIDVRNFQFETFLATVYKDKIIVLTGYVGENRSNSFTQVGYLGILDLKTRKWAWYPLHNEDGSILNRDITIGCVMVFNDQLIIYERFYIGENHIPIMVYDLVNKRMKSTIRLSNSSNDSKSINAKNKMQNQSKSMPAYAIVLIAIGCTLLLGIFIFLLYTKNNKSRSKNGKTKSNRPILEVWANPDIDNTNNIINFEENSFSSALYSNGLYK